MKIKCWEAKTMADPRHKMELDVAAALECAERTTWTTNELVARTLETAITGKEAATTLHHAYSAQVHVARVLEWVKERGRSQRLPSSETAPPMLDEWLVWMRRARDHAEKLCGCFPSSAQAGEKATRIAEWAERWPQDYAAAKSLAEQSLEKIDTSIDTIERQHIIEHRGF
jgi:hypothetical protein